MSRFGWAYVNSLITGAVANGPTNSIQFNSGSQILSGSSNFTYDPTTSTVYLTGTLRADTLIVSASQILKSGSTIFGDDISDTHQFTGSILGGIVSGTIARFVAITGSTINSTLITGSSLVVSASVISASTYLGVPTGSATSPGDGDKAIQFNSGSTFSGSSNFTYNYSTNNVSLTGALLMSGTSYISEVDYIDFDVSASIPAYKGARLYYDSDTTDLAYYGSVSGQAIQIGQQTVVKVKNSTGSPISKGKLVRIVGGVGDNPLINTASWENDNNSANTLGMLMSTVAHNDFGYVLLSGVIIGVNTDPATFTAGQVIYLSSSGDYTATTPIAPKHTVRLGEVVRAHATVGSIFIKVDNGYEIDELHNILITSASTGDLLVYNSSSALWENAKSLSGSYTITGSLTISGSSTFTNIGPAIFSGTINTNNTISGTIAQFTTLTASAIASTTIPAFGPNQAVQYNNNGVLNGSANLKFDGTQVSLTGSLQVVSSSTTVAELVSTGIRTTGKPIQVRNISTSIVAIMDENGIISGSIGRFGNVTGSTITSSAFVGDGTLVTNIQGNNVKPVGNAWSIQFKNSDGTLTGSSNLLLSSSNFLQISNSGIVYPNINQNINFSVNNTDYIIFASGSALTGTLPASVSGRIVKIYNYGATNVYITGSGISGFVGPTGNNIPDFILTTNPRSRDFLYFSDTSRWLII